MFLYSRVASPGQTQSKYFGTPPSSTSATSSTSPMVLGSGAGRVSTPQRKPHAPPAFSVSPSHTPSQSPQLKKAPAALAAPAQQQKTVDINDEYDDMFGSFTAEELDEAERYGKTPFELVCVNYLSIFCRLAIQATQATSTSVTPPSVAKPPAPAAAPAFPSVVKINHAGQKPPAAPTFTPKPPAPVAPAPAFPSVLKINQAQQKPPAPQPPTKPVAAARTPAAFSPAPTAIATNISSSPSSSSAAKSPFTNKPAPAAKAAPAHSLTAAPAVDSMDVSSSPQQPSSSSPKTTPKNKPLPPASSGITTTKDEKRTEKLKKWSKANEQRFSFLENVRDENGKRPGMFVLQIIFCFVMYFLT